MSSKLRIASALLLVLATLKVMSNAMAALANQWAWYLLKGLLLVLVLGMVGVHLWRGRQWAYTSALVCSAGLAAILVLYDVASASVWGREGWRALEYVFSYLPAGLLAGAFALLALDRTFPGARRRAATFVAVALGLELVLMALIARFGVGGFSGSWYQTVLGLTQIPGANLLSQLGMCCGYENETIISDVIDPHWGGITRHGIPTLVAANTVGMLAVFATARSFLMRVRHVRGPAAHAATSVVRG